MYAVMWSEHCSYKSSQASTSARFPTEAPWVLVGPGRGRRASSTSATASRSRCASRATTTRRRSSRTRARRPASAASSATSSRWARARSRSWTRCASARSTTRARATCSRASSSGISGYGNAVGVPTVGGEVVFDDCYRDNPLVNVLCLGMLPHRAARARPRRGRRATSRVLLGSSTGRDGIGGASVLASAGFEEGARGEAAVGAGRRPVRGEAAHRGVPRAARRRPRGRRAGPRRRRALVRGVGDRGEDRRGHGRRRRARAPAASRA